MNNKHIVLLTLLSITSLEINTMHVATPERTLLNRTITAGQYAQLILTGYYDHPSKQPIEQYSYKLRVLRNTNYIALGIRDLYDDVIRILRLAPIAFTQQEVIPHLKAYINKQYDYLLNVRIQRMSSAAGAA